jgi:hypothetical protein
MIKGKCETCKLQKTCKFFKWNQDKKLKVLECKEYERKKE